MNLIKSASFSALVLLASAAAQAQTGLYLGGSLGNSHATDSSASLGLTDRSATGGKLYGGYSFTPNLAVELGHVRLGRFTGAAAEATARGSFVDAVGTWPLGNGFSALGRIGLFDGKISQSTGASDSGTSVKLGAGLQYELSKTVALRGEWERYRLDSFGGSTTRADQVSVGMNLRF